MTVNDALESVILVDRDDRPLGTAPKLATAISVLIHDGEGRLLVDRADVGAGSRSTSSCISSSSLAR